MRKSIRMFPLLLLLLICVTLSACAVESESGRVEIINWKYDDSKASFSCDAKLSGAGINGHVFAVVYAESGKTKQIQQYPANELTPIFLTDVDTTDFVRVVRTDPRFTPVAGSEILRMRENGLTAFRNFEENLKKLGDRAPSPDGDLTQSGGSTRLLVSCTEALNWEDYGVDYSVDDVVAGSNNFYIVQFNSSVKAKRCKEKLEQLPSVRYALLDSKVVAKLEGIEPDRAGLSSGGDEETRYHSGGVGETKIGLYAEDLLKRKRNEEIIVAVADTGVEREHSFLKDRLLPGYDFIEMDDVPQDEKIHGTHVAGIIVDCTPDMNVKILPVRVLDKTGCGKDSSIVIGIYYAVEHGADIINLSLAIPGHNDALDDAISYAVSKNVTVVAAAGNYNTEAIEYCPAHMREKCITVAAIGKKEDKSFQRLGNSDYGKAVDISAPGGDIEGCVPKNDFELMGGTSQATPHVSAAAALLKCEYGGDYRPNEISAALKSAASSAPVPLKYHFTLRRIFNEDVQKTIPQSGAGVTYVGRVRSVRGHTRRRRGGLQSAHAG